jgi:hypothetical protein
VCDHSHAAKVADIMRETITGARDEHEVAGDAETGGHLVKNMKNVSGVSL